MQGSGRPMSLHVSCRPGFAAQKHVAELEKEFHWLLAIVDGIITAPHHLLLLARKRQLAEELMRVLAERPFLYLAHYALASPPVWLLNLEHFMHNPVFAAVLKVKSILKVKNLWSTSCATPSLHWYSRRNSAENLGAFRRHPISAVMLKVEHGKIICLSLMKKEHG